MRASRCRPTAPGLLLGTCGALLLGSCGSDPVRTTTLNLGRPSALALACMGRAGASGLPAAQPLGQCAAPASATTAPEYSLFGLVANGSRGDVALFVATTTTEPLLDLEPNAGFGFVPVGAQPTDLQTTTDGCQAVSANEGSCDLAVLDLPALVLAACRSTVRRPAELTRVCPTAAVATGAVVRRVLPRTAAGPLLARPHELRLVPATATAASGAATDPQGCAIDGARHAYVTFPGCDLVAEIDLATGRVIQGLVLTPRGFELTSEPRCPRECSPHGEGLGPIDGGNVDRADGGSAGAGDSAIAPDGAQRADAAIRDGGTIDARRTIDARPAADAGPADATAPPSTTGTTSVQPTGRVRPTGLALTEDGRRLFVSAAGANFVSVVDVGSDGGFGAPRRIVLEGEGARTTRLRLSPPTRQFGRFLYAIAADHTVRAISVERERECEMNLDLARLDETVPAAQAGCFVADEGPPRRVGALGPGLALGRLVPRDVAFVQVPPSTSTSATTSTQVTGPLATPLIGTFALVAYSDGSVVVLDVEDDTYVDAAGSPVSQLHLPHRLRNEQQGLADIGPSAQVATISGAGSGGVPVVVNSLGGQALANQGITLRAPGEALATDWRLLYEPTLLTRISGQLVLRGGELLLDDRGVDLCASGVHGRLEDQGRVRQHGDIVALSGCRSADDCPDGQLCRKPVAQQTDTGLCLDRDRQDEQFRQCSPWLRGAREFLVRQARVGELVLDLLPVERQPVVKQAEQPAGGCRDNADCEPDYACALEDRALPTRPDLSLLRGECFRAGCAPQASPPVGCAEGEQCATPLSGGPPICTVVPAPIDPLPGEAARACTVDADCRPAEEGLERSCQRASDCPDPATECRRVSSEAAAKTCVDRGWRCSSLSGLAGRCLRPSPCFAALQPYEVRAGRSFVLGGFSRWSADPRTGVCRADPTADPLLENRLPIDGANYPLLTGPVCRRTPGPLETPDPNPCLERLSDQGYTGFTAKQSEQASASVTEPSPATVLHFRNPQLGLSLGLSHLADATLNRASSTATVLREQPPLPQRGLTIALTLRNAFAPFTVASSTAQLALPAALVTGPDGYVYVADSGLPADLSTTGGQGQVRRLSQSAAALQRDFQVR
ncbi:MAG: hypothetical protein IPG96_16055 [Proteobacteria bacterium]|nr:hypothetical protein [Pseudomonadota bacterium]